MHPPYIPPPCFPNSPVSSSLDTPVSCSPVTPVSCSPNSPVSCSPDTPVSCSPDTPVSCSPDTPVSCSPDTPVSCSNDIPVTCSSNTPVSCLHDSPIDSAELLPEPPKSTSELKHNFPRTCTLLVKTMYPTEVPPESPPNSHNTPDSDEDLPNLTVKLPDNEPTTPTHPQHPPQPNSHIAPLMCINFETPQPVDRSVIISKVNQKSMKANTRSRFQKFPRRYNYHQNPPHPVPLMSLKIDPPQFYPSRGKSSPSYGRIPYDHRRGRNRRPDVEIPTRMKISLSRCQTCSNVTRKVQESAGTSENTPVSCKSASDLRHASSTPSTAHVA
ncbi:unnamed protein product [Allacma fusca]|uniref:Uncharacterized protein n=1 Tax=Allacma fusca TaxID=39272 RepID=A0A8J2JGS6_9HEXA|nr:unnamed protein product [Allacma fusca]